MPIPDPIAELFQKLVTLPNTGKERDDRLGIAVEQCMAAFETKRASVEGRLLIADGRAAYCDLLRDRVAHYRNRIRSFLATIDPSSEALSLSIPNQHALRDFYHDAYYCLFFAARHALVRSGGYDCSQHAIMARQLARRFENDATASAAAKNLEKFQTDRNDSDYVMSIERLAPLASTTTISDRVEALDGILKPWNLF